MWNSRLGVRVVAGVSGDRGRGVGDPGTRRVIGRVVPRVGLGGRAGGVDKSGCLSPSEPY